MIYYFELAIFSLIAVGILIDPQWTQRLGLRLRILLFHLRLFLTVNVWVSTPLKVFTKIHYYVLGDVCVARLALNVWRCQEQIKRIEKDMKEIL